MDDITVLGDTNLDYFRWLQPEYGVAKMVDRVKEDIETLGFGQIIQGVTRTWPGQPDSLIDQCWMNSLGRIIYYRNIERAFSDHNLIIVSFRTKRRIEDKHEVVKREMKIFYTKIYREEIAKIDWRDLYQSGDLDEIYHIF